MIAPGKRHAFDEVLLIEPRDVHRNRRFVALAIWPKPLFISRCKNCPEFARFLLE